MPLRLQVTEGDPQATKSPSPQSVPSVHSVGASTFHARNGELTTTHCSPTNCLLRLGQQTCLLRARLAQVAPQPNPLLLNLSFLTGPPFPTPQPVFCPAFGLPSLKPPFSSQGPRFGSFPNFFLPPGAAPNLAPSKSIPPSRPAGHLQPGSLPAAAAGATGPFTAAAGSSCPAPAPTARMRPRPESTLPVRALGGTERADWAPRGGGTGIGPGRLPSAWRKRGRGTPRRVREGGRGSEGERGRSEEVVRGVRWGLLRRRGVGVS